MFKYGNVEYSDAKVGDRVRYVDRVSGRPGAVMRPRARSEENATLVRLTGDLGYVALFPTTGVAALSGGASVVSISSPILAGASFRVE